MLAHIDVRKEFAAAGLLYLEYFYLITYAAVLACLAEGLPVLRAPGCAVPGFPAS